MAKTAKSISAIGVVDAKPGDKNLRGRVLKRYRIKVDGPITGTVYMDEAQFEQFQAGTAVTIAIK